MKIAVIGDIIIDKYLYGTCERISPEAPVPVLRVEKSELIAGGAANIAKNLKALGADVTLFSVLGKVDKDIETNVKHFLLNGITTHLVNDDRKTSIKTRLMAQNQQMFRYDVEDTFEIATTVADQLVENFKTYCSDNKIDAVVFSDYNKGVFSKYCIDKIFEITRLLHLKVFIDPKQNLKTYEKTFLITPNIKEASSLFNLKITNKLDVEKNISYLQRLRDLYEIENVIITLGADGAYLISENVVQHFATKQISVYDVTGAGDTFLAALVFDYLRNKDIKVAISFANIAASLSVQKKGTAVVSLFEINQASSKISEISDLENNIKFLQKTKKVVFANGVFDILHIGHIQLLKQAKALGDYLIVAINSDQSVKRLKGKDRPILSQHERATVLAGLELVDCVIIFSEDTPYEVLKKLQPDILVKGSDYKLEDVIGKEFVKETVLIDIVTGFSTSNIIEKTKDVTAN